MTPRKSAHQPPTNLYNYSIELFNGSINLKYISKLQHSCLKDKECMSIMNFSVECFGARSHCGGNARIFIISMSTRNEFCTQLWRKGNGINESSEGIHIAVTMAQKNICKKYDITVVLWTSLHTDLNLIFTTRKSGVMLIGDFQEKQRHLNIFQCQTYYALALSIWTQTKHSLLCIMALKRWNYPLNPFNTTQFARSDGFQVLLDRHVMYVTRAVSDFELVKCLKVRAIPG